MKRFPKFVMKALVVDDEEDIGFLVSKFLSGEGFDADHVTRIDTARKKIEGEDYQVFFLDLRLPDGSGLDLIADIRQKTRDCRVIVISAYDGVIETRRAREMGVKFFIKKPFTKKEVIETLQELT